MVIQYPRTCEACGSIYSMRTNYSRHLREGRCERKILARNKQLRLDDPQPQNIVNNIQNIHVTNNNINLNLTIQQDFADLLKAPYHACSAKEKKQIIDVLTLLRDKGYKTASDVHNFILDQYVTIQEMEKTIRNYDLDCLRVIAKEYRQDDKKEHITHCVVALFNRLVCKDEPFITPDTLKSNPLHKAANGQLSAWSEDSQYSYGSQEFGVSLTSDNANESEGQKQWTPMQDEATWKTLIEMIGLRFIEALQMQKDYDAWRRDSDDALNIELADYWEKTLDDKTSKNGHSIAMTRLCAELATICRQDYVNGWHNLTKMASKVDKDKITATTAPTEHDPVIEQLE